MLHSWPSICSKTIRDIFQVAYIRQQSYNWAKVCYYQREASMRWYRLFISWLQTLTIWQSGLLASLISLQTLQDALNTLGYPAVTLFIMIESAGIPFPGETMLLLASFYSALDNHLQIPFVIASAAAGAIIGDNIGFYVGRTGGRAFVERFGRYLFLKPQHLDRAEKFFAKHGDKTVFFGRFIAILRTWSAFLAGVNRMRWPAFLIYNAAGGVAWATIFGTLGYLGGRIFRDNFAQVERLARTAGWIGAAFIVIGIVAPFIIYRWYRARRSRTATTDTKTTEEKAGEETSKSTVKVSAETDVKNEATANRTEEFIQGDGKEPPLL